MKFPNKMLIGSKPYANESKYNLFLVLMNEKNFAYQKIDRFQNMKNSWKQQRSVSTCLCPH